MGRSAHRNKKHHGPVDSAHRVSKKSDVFRRQHSQQPARNGKSHTRSTVRSGEASRNVDQDASQGQHAKVKSPFGKHDNILLVGEGDFSFALSLAQNYKVKKITATCYDSRQALETKYPSINARLAQLQNLDGTGLRDAPERWNSENQDTEQDWEGFSPVSDHNDIQDSNNTGGPDGHKMTNVTVHCGIDATKLSSAHKKIFNRGGPYSKIVFNFPHVGGISTDVNRQVRSNQQLLVGFFDAAKHLLVTPTHPMKEEETRSVQDRYATSSEGEDEDSDAPSNRPIPTTGHILVTLFEGEPYTLWNIRDLARHCGLKVIESFKFPWAAYPGYQHARTIGDVTTGKDRSEQGKRRGAWRGEERDARCYVLTLKEAEGPYPAAGQGKKRKKSDSDDSD